MTSTPGTPYHIISDLHLEFHPEVVSMKTLLEKYPQLTCTDSAPSDTILLLAGDIGSFSVPNLRPFLKDCSELYRHVIYILGNHEYYSYDGLDMISIEKVATDTANWINDEVGRANFHFLNKSSVVLDGVKYLGATLWANIDDYQRDIIELKINDYKLINRPDGSVITADDTIEIHKSHVEWLTSELSDKDTPTVIITHHLPTKKLQHEKYAIYGNVASSFYTDLEYLMQDNVRLWVCGHTHSYVKSKVSDTLLITSPFGYAYECGGAKIDCVYV